MFYEMLSDGTIGRFTKNKHVANKLGLNKKTRKEIIYGHDGRCYFSDAVPNETLPSYRQMRARKYPCIGDQLDMIYHDMENGTRIWQNTISDIKSKYPKN